MRMERRAEANPRLRAAYACSLLAAAALFFAASCGSADRDFGGGQSGEAGAGAAGLPQGAASGATSTAEGGGARGPGSSAGAGGDLSVAGGGAGNGCEFEGGCDCSDGEMRDCGPMAQVGICKKGSQTCAEGAWGECRGAVEPMVRDCTSTDDNDCDGSPDNTADAVCVCTPDMKRPCGEHPGQDGKGLCKAGEQTCVGSGATGVWGGCEGSVGPKAVDRCDTVNDANCNGSPNEGCDCIGIEKDSCGNLHGAKGVCASTQLTCSSTGKWPNQSGCGIGLQNEACGSEMKDEDCDGEVNEGCACQNGQKKTCETVHNAKGECKGIQLTCLASGVWPAASACSAGQAESCAADGKDEDCDGQVNEADACACTAGDKKTCGAVHNAKGECASIQLTCTAAGQWPSGASCTSNKAEACTGDGKDENCDGQVDETCDCPNATTRPCGACKRGSQTCNNGQWGTCNDVTTIGTTGAAMLCVKGGTFNMGSNSPLDDCENDCAPLHSVPLQPFWLDAVEVTLAMYNACVTAGACLEPYNDFSGCNTDESLAAGHPANCLEHSDAVSYCAWAKKRLPLEEEWEYAARGTDGRIYPWGSASPGGRSNYDTHATQIVTSYPLGNGPFGHYDLAGNVWEWTASQYCPYAGSGFTPACGSGLMTVRGGMYSSVDYPLGLRTTYRFAFPPGFHDASVGFRCAMDL